MFQNFKRKKSTGNKENIVSLPAEDEILETYQEAAQKYLDYLIDFIQSHERNEKLFRYTVKALFMEDDDGEHMWVQVDGFKEGFFIGRLANEPETLTMLKWGDQVKVARENVEDWILEDFTRNEEFGNFSLKYIEDKARQTNKEVN